MILGITSNALQIASTITTQQTVISQGQQGPGLSSPGNPSSRLLPDISLKGFPPDNSLTGRTLRKAREKDKLVKFRFNEDESPDNEDEGYLVYEATYVNETRTEGYLNWYDGDGKLVDNFKATSGSGNPKKYTLPEGEYSASNYKDTEDDKFSRFNIGFKIKLNPSKVWDSKKRAFRSSLLIHPARSNGTEGCIGLKGNKAEILRFQDRIKRYLERPKSKISLRVKYSK